MSESDANEEYFESYGDLEVHKLMLSDSIRNEAYRAAICDNADMFKNKVVLDVGTGTGFLAILCAKAGASKVYAVEASDMAELATVTVHENNVAEIVEVIQNKIELVELPEQVDIIVSEWMGFYLLHESMLDSILFARDKYLKPNGLMYPSRCILYTAPSYSSEIFKFWEDISGVQMNTIGQLYRTKYTGKPEIMALHPNNILSKPVQVLDFETKNVQLNELTHITKRIETECVRNGQVNGIGLWFDVQFPGDVVLSTAPVTSPTQLTHWKQTVIILPMEKDVQKAERIHYSLDISKNSVNPRHYDIELSILDPDETTAAGNQQKQSMAQKEFCANHAADSDYDEYNSGDDD